MPPKLAQGKDAVSSSGSSVPLPAARPYLSSALVNEFLSWGFFAFREHTGSSSGYMKTLLVARIHATCFGKQGYLQAVREKNLR